MILDRPEPSTSDQELSKLLQIAVSRRSGLRLMRIGGPQRFRYDVISVRELRTKELSPALSALVSTDIPSIKILLADPNGEPFLSRLDKEGASSWKIWRVRREILQFAEGLIRIAALRETQGSLEIGLHREELIWNLGIVGIDEVLISPYGHGTGHDDSTMTRWITSKEAKDFAASFFNYFEAVSRHYDTVWLSGKSAEFEVQPRWPSLYKGNAILANDEDIDGTAEPTIDDGEVCKICVDPKANEVEEQWLGLSEVLRRKQVSFRPGKIVRSLETPRGQGIIAERIPGPTLFQIVASLHDVAASEEADVKKCNRVLGALLEDSLRALLEFRILAEDVWPRSRRTVYPYVAKLCSALDETRRHFSSIPDAIWHKGLLDAKDLGRELEGYANVPFRDAHLKNRIWQDSSPTQKVVRELLRLPHTDVLKQVHSKLKDIDFETACFDVTQWEDPFHILFFEYSSVGGLSPCGLRLDLWRRFEEALGSETDLGLWRTGLARATREYCRRLWYRNVMPQTCVRRYSLESPNYFLRLALECSARASGYLGLRRLLEAFEVFAVQQVQPDDSQEAGIGEPRSPLGVTPSIQGDKSDKYPDYRRIGESSDDLRHRPFKVFVSYSHHDEEHRKHLERSLVLLKRAGLIETWSDRCIPPGKNWKRAITRELREADIIIFLVSLDFLASEYCTDVEVRFSLRQHKAGHAIIVPIVIRPVPFRHTDFAHIQALPREGKAVTTWQYEDEAWVDIDEGLRNLIAQMEKAPSA